MQNHTAHPSRAEHGLPMVLSKADTTEVFFGSVAAELTTKTIVHPLDTLKTRLQYLVLPPRARTSQKLPIVGDVQLGLEILAAATRRPQHSISEPLSLPVPRHKRVLNGMRSLYRGLGPQLVGVVPIAFVYMPTYEVSKAALHGTALQHTPLAGVLTGVASAVVRVPVSVVKARIQLGLHSTASDAVAHARSAGKGGLYAGFRATVVLDACYATVQFTCLEQLRRLALALARPAGGGTDPSQLDARVNAAIGFFTGVLAAVATEPLDVVRTRLMTQRAKGEGAFQYQGLTHGLRKAVVAEGVASLWKGLLPRLLTKAVGSLIWYTTYMEARRCWRRVGAVADTS